MDENKYEEIKRNAISVIYNSDGIPSEINNILEQLKKALISKITQEKVNFRSTLEYVEGQIEVFKASTLTKIGESRKNKNIEDFIYDIKLFKEKLENDINEDVLEERKQEDEKDVYDNAFRITGELNHIIQNICSQYRRTLGARGLKDSSIEDKVYDFSLYAKYYLKNKCEKRVIEAFQKDNYDLRKFEEDILNEILNLKDTKNNDDKDGFKESLKVQVPTLEKQKEDAVKRESKLENDKIDRLKSLPEDVLK